MHKPLHPGEIVRDALCNEETGLTVSEAAQKLCVQRTTLSRLFNGHSGISAEMAMRLAMLLGTSIEMWLNLQRDYEIWKVQKMRPKPKIRQLKLAA
ncbi:MAG: HigA family addiction module antidote protein [Myxococcales bacterium]|nr:HigA family addiction module antidote protein [Myxococcales bacterium]USN50801.1 MAG: HigA family addiction module antidote protein [Myxococcales bacterium]